MHAHDYKGYEEAMILYVLALGSPTHAISPDAWKARIGNYKWDTFYGQQFINYAPLFIHQYSHIWLDFRGIHDAYTREKGVDYFENSRRATYAQRAYAAANPGGFRGYGENMWGLTASIGPMRRQGIRGRTGDPVPHLLGARRQQRRHPRRRHHRADGRGRIAALRARDRAAGAQGDAGAARRSRVPALRVHRRVQRDVPGVRPDAQARRRRSTRRAGSRATTSASTRDRSS